MSYGAGMDWVKQYAAAEKRFRDSKESVRQQYQSAIRTAAATKPSQCDHPATPGRTGAQHVRDASAGLDS